MASQIKSTPKVARQVQFVSVLGGIKSEMKMCMVPSGLKPTVTDDSKAEYKIFDKFNLTQKIANLTSDSTAFVKELKFVKDIGDVTKAADGLTRNILKLKEIANTVSLTLSKQTIYTSTVKQINQSLILIEDYIIQIKTIKIEFNIPAKMELATKQAELENLTKSLGSRIQIEIGKLVGSLTLSISTFANKSPQVGKMLNSLGKLMRGAGYFVNQLPTIGAVFAYFEFDKAAQAYEQNPNDETEKAFYVKFINVIIACVLAVVLAVLMYFAVTVATCISIILIIVAGIDIVFDVDLFAEVIYEIITNIIPNVKTYLGNKIKNVETNMNSVLNEIERKIKGLYGLP